MDFFHFEVVELNQTFHLKMLDKIYTSYDF